MRKRLGTIVLAIVLILCGPDADAASPLIFKSTTVVKEHNQLLGELNTAKFSKVRIGVRVESVETLTQRINIFAVEDGKEILMHWHSQDGLTYSATIDVPPTTLRVRAIGNATYSLFVWGS